MKKSNKTLVLFAALIFAGQVAYADGNAFTPLDFNETAQTPVQTVNSIPPAGTAVNSIELSGGEVPIGNNNIQNAILELDNAQTDIRGDLLNYKAKYADVDAQYKLVKNERAMLAKQVKSIEKRIKSIDKAKEKIRKNMI